MKLLKEITSLPTAPFAEDHVIAYVKKFVVARPRLKLRKDSVGNLLIDLPGTVGKQRWVFSAHMDHPGFRAIDMLDTRTVRASFNGFVVNEFFPGTKVRFFSEGEEIAGPVIGTTPADGERAILPKEVTVRVSKPVRPGSIGMFDQGEGRLNGRIFYSRALDDLAGVAAALRMLDLLAKKPPKVNIAVLLTRAEEEGFLGAIGAVLHPTLLRKADRIIGIECSAMQPYAKQGDGVILRIGDRTSVFHSGLTYFINEQAAAIAKKHKSFKLQRALMPGGTCESTVYDAWGYSAAAVCVPLGNYHNMNRETKKIGPESIHADDWLSMVRLFVTVANNAHNYEPGMKGLKEKILERFKKFESQLKAH